MLLSVRLLVISVMLFVLGHLGAVSPIRSFFQRVLNPVQAGMYSLSVRTVEEVEFWRNVRDLRSRNTELEEENTELFSKIVSLKEVERENNFLREELKVSDNSPRNFGRILASVVGRGTEESQTTILIDKGSIDGINVGDVVEERGVLIGVVDQVLEKRSKVKLITDPTFVVSALDQDSESRARGIVRGLYGTKVNMEKILLDEKVSIGDTIITSGEDGKFPKGLIIGKVEKLIIDESDVLKKAQISLYRDIDKVEGVFVLSQD